MWVLGLLVGIDLLSHGIWWLFLAAACDRSRAMRSAGRRN